MRLSNKEGPIFIDWNADHPFHERFVLANRDDRNALNAVDAMIFSMAAAELKVFDADNRDFVESWKAIFSSNLRTFRQETAPLPNAPLAHLLGLRH